MAEWTHRVTNAEMGCSLDLKDITESQWNIEYHRLPFHRVVWRHKKIGCTCLLYANGKAICHGGKDKMRQYARLLQKMKYPIRMKKIKIVTRSAAYSFRKSLDFRKIAQYTKGSYEPEIYHGLRFIKEGLHYTLYKSGKVIVTGIKSEKEIDTKVNPTLLEIEII